MRLLFIVTSFWAYGELQIAMDFATGMKMQEMQYNS